MYNNNNKTTTTNNNNNTTSKTINGGGNSEPSPKTNSLKTGGAKSPPRKILPRGAVSSGGNASEPMRKVATKGDTEGKSEPTLSNRGVKGGNPPLIGSEVQAEPSVIHKVGAMDGKASTSKGLSPSFPGTSGASLRGPSTKPKRQLGQSKRSFSDLRMATKILERYGGQNDSQVSEKHSQTLEWARKVIRGAEEGSEKGVEANAPQPDSGVKRQRSLEEDIPQEKRPRIGGGPPKTFSEVAKQAGSIILGVMDSGKEDGAISREEWKKVASAISAVFMRVVRENPGPPPSCESAGWHSGSYKRIVCADERSASMYRAAVALVGEVWEGAKLRVVDRKDLPVRPRARVWLPSEPSASKEMEEILRYCNPTLPTHNWRVVKVEKTEGSYRQALILLNAESLSPLAEAKGVINYGFEKVVLKVYQTDARGDAPAHPDVLGDVMPTVEEAPVDMEVESVMSEGDNADDVRSLPGSVISIGSFFDRAEEERLLASESEDAVLGVMERILEDDYSSDKTSTL